VCVCTVLLLLVVECSLRACTGTPLDVASQLRCVALRCVALVTSLYDTVLALSVPLVRVRPTPLFREELA